MKNSADQGGCYPQRPKADVDNIPRDLQNSICPTKAEFNNCFIIHLNTSPFLKEFRHSCLTSPLEYKYRVIKHDVS